MATTITTTETGSWPTRKVTGRRGPRVTRTYTAADLEALGFDDVDTNLVEMANKKFTEHGEAV